MATQELIIDYFAGGGGASEGIERALGRPVDIAVNHNPAAIEMHRANHPNTKHLTEDAFKVDPRKATGGKPVGLMWLSPDCRHFSRAKGGKPVKKEIRGLAWVAIRWAAEVGPRVIILENVREFEQWGPLVPLWRCACGWKGTEGQAKLVRRRARACPRCESLDIKDTGQEVPDPDRKGLTFKQFVGRLKGLGYKVEWKVLNAADYGAPTHRRRLFLVARNDGRPIVWPDPTHGDPKTIGKDLFSGDLKPWRTAAECIDWSDVPRSIFDRKKPLAEKTLKRIAMGIKRYVLDNPRPFLVDMTRENRPHGADEPLGTVTTQDNRFNLVTPFVAPVRTHGGGGNDAGSAEDPLRTVTATKRGEFAVVSPIVTPLTHAGERRANGPDEPLPTVTGAHRGELAVVSPVLVGCGGPSHAAEPKSVDAPAGVVMPKDCRAVVAPVVARLGQTGGNGGYVNGPDEPLTTVTSKAEHLLITPVLDRQFGKSAGAPADVPLGTTTGKGKSALIAPVVANLAHGEARDGRARGLRAGAVSDPLGTVHAGGGSFALIAPTLVQTGYGEREGQAPRTLNLGAPLGTLVGTTKHALVAAFVAKHFGGMVGVGADTPLPTTTARGTQNQLAVANLVHLKNNTGPTGCDAPTHTITAGGNHAALVYSFLVKYFGTAIGCEVDVPMPTATGKARFGLVTVTIDGEPFVIVDIGMRMLRPRELATAQSFGPKYILTGTATNQVERIGNSVPPDLAEAVAGANCADMAAGGLAA